MTSEIINTDSLEKDEDTSDDENGWEKAFALRENGLWEPEPEVMFKYLMELESKGYCELQWECPGRRPLTPQDTDDRSDDHENTTGEAHEEDNSDFEFKDEMSQLKLPVRPAGENPGPRGSAKKKTTSWMPSSQTWQGIGN
ncbi:PAXIP1-associated glutamate-rich protein 1 [Nilaparvata lugens]|uniref:PAXIP1-associated glutamate-rich protein 1 n=1 Tax=Nilaparvata lugens TaxID=108931 RepID=UPI00193CD456|nr:PAXIP1-associated glutamate-rich protein 1 [Nilaparvata lugens]